MSVAQISVDSVFDVLGIDATLDPEGTATIVKLLPSEGDEDGRFGSVEIVDASGVYEIRVADFQGLGDGTVFDISGQKRRVQSFKIRDQRRLKVTLNTVEIS